MTEVLANGEYDSNEGIPETIGWLYAPPGKGFPRGDGDGETRRPFWTALESLAWIVSGSNYFVNHIGKIERQEFGPTHPKAALGQLLLLTSRQFCNCESQKTTNDVDDDGCYCGPCTFWRDCVCVGKASHQLFDAIRTGKVQAINPETRARIDVTHFISLDLRDSGADWLNLEPSPLFVAEALFAVFSTPLRGNAGAETTCKKSISEVQPKEAGSPSEMQTTAKRKRPGPAPDSDWPHAIAKVTQDCRDTGYSQSLKRGDKAAILDLLLRFMADRDKYYSDDTAAKYAKEVIAALPDN